MKLRKDGKPDGRTGKAMARKPKQSHPWIRPFGTLPQSRAKAEESGYKNT